MTEQNTLIPIFPILPIFPIFPIPLFGVSRWGHTLLPRTGNSTTTTDNQYNPVIVTARTDEEIDKMFGEKEIKGKKYSTFLKD